MFKKAKPNLKSKAASFLTLAIGLCSIIPVIVATASPAEEGPMRPLQNIFAPLSKPAQISNDVGWLVSMICLVIFVIVGGLLAYACYKFRAKPGDDRNEPPQIYGSFQIELAWTIIPSLIVVALVLVTSRTIGELQAAKMPADAVKVEVVGHQWWWEFRYPDSGVVTANELHIPISKVTHLSLQSADVIHSFWVPQLAGKVDLIPNHKNEMWYEPTATGTYFGNCAEYCGTQHANMLIRVVVQTQENFDAWIASQKAGAVSEALAETPEKKTFMKLSCVNCHNIQSTPAKGIFGPDLTHLMARQTLGAGVAPLNEENLHAWVRDPHDLKVGCQMPNMQLSDKELDEVTKYLLTLK